MKSIKLNQFQNFIIRHSFSEPDIFIKANYYQSYIVSSIVFNDNCLKRNNLKFIIKTQKQHFIERNLKF